MHDAIRMQWNAQLLTIMGILQLNPKTYEKSEDILWKLK